MHSNCLSLSGDQQREVLPSASANGKQKSLLQAAECVPHKVGWDSSSWSWDSVRFQAQPAAASPSRGLLQGVRRANDCPEDEDGQLSLKLGGSLYSHTEDNIGSRNGKRRRSSSPQQSQFPTCQVDECTADLSKAKEYHRRHKVCEVHSKAANAQVSHSMQRFCQQCSRFHPLPEFDEGKRSCRRRLAGHNRRRRKAQPDSAVAAATAAQAGLMVEDDRPGKGPEILSFLNILSHLQASPSTDAFSWLLQSSLKGQLSAVGRSAQENPVSCLGEEGPGPGPLTLASSSTEAQKSQASPSTRFGQPGSSVPSISQIPSTICARPISSVPKGPAQLPSSLAMTLQQLVADQSMPKLNRSSSSARHVIPTSEVQKLLPPHPTTENGSAASDMCDKIQDHDVTVNSTAGVVEGHSLGMVLADIKNRLSPENVSDASHHSIDLEHPPPQHSGDVSQSGSDQQSPGSSSADWEDRNHRISFKLFDRHPAEFPEGLRAQIDEWLAHRPSDLESYIKPGCVVLTVFLSMPKSAWVELKEDLAASVKKLLSLCNDNFWCKGRILVQAEHQKVFVVDGDILESIVAEPLSYPYIQAVRPLAIVAGEQNTLVLKGFNFTQPGTRLCCAYQGRFIRQELSGLEQEGSRWPEKEALFQLDSVFTCNTDLRSVVGRCFVEVECGNYGGDWKPVIIADGSVCAEICTLEDEIAVAASLAGAAAQRQGFRSSDVLDCTETMRLVAEEEVTCFLHELGWFFQRSCFQDLKDPPVVDLISSRRLRLLLVFSVERNWCAVVQKLLDILFEVNNLEAAFTKLFDVLREEVSLLHRAVQRKCRPMVELLLGYVPSSLAHANESEFSLFQRKLQFKSHWASIFRPDVNGPAGLTPLHIAANMQDSEEVVDALTSDPCQSGLHAWFNKQDDAGETPFKSALARGNLKSIQVVRMKLAHLEDVQTVSINIPADLPWEWTQKNRESKSRAEEILNLELPTWVTSASSGEIAELSRPATTACKSQACRRLPRNVGSIKGHMYKPFLLSMISLATLCVCVCLLFRAAVKLKNGPTFRWESLQSGPK
ncbi:unnamed protein product [Sphagnum jensenii]|uniref:SBP-type domain-containing protein n=1 Tax=Sphagnum jensenii TaxID=128206 RepID=A0ABP1A5N3_9BRYO